MTDRQIINQIIRQVQKEFGYTRMDLQEQEMITTRILEDGFKKERQTEKSKIIKRLKHSYIRHSQLMKELEGRTKGHETEFTFHGGFSSGYESGYCSALEQAIDLLEE